METQSFKRKFNLTTMQKKAYVFIKDYIEEHDQAPSFDEIMVGVGLKSKSGVHRLVYALKDRGWIDFIMYRKRSIVILEGEA